MFDHQVQFRLEHDDLDNVVDNRVMSSLITRQSTVEKEVPVPARRASKDIRGFLQDGPARTNRDYGRSFVILRKKNGLFSFCIPQLYLNF